MYTPKFRMKELGPSDFQDAVFFSKGDVFAPVVILPQQLHLDDNFQPLSSLNNCQMRLRQTWLTIAGPMAVGQYSLVKKCAVSVIVHGEVILRRACPAEIADDVDHFGEQVAIESPKTDPENKYKYPVFNFLGSPVYYTGPLRLVRAIFQAQVIFGPLPENIGQLATDLDALIEKKAIDEELEKVDDGYLFLHANQGALNYAGGENVKALTSMKMNFLGKLEMRGNNFFFFPSGDENHPIDFTEDLYKGGE